MVPGVADLRTGRGGAEVEHPMSQSDDLLHLDWDVSSLENSFC